VARVKLPHDPALDLQAVHGFLHSRMADRYHIEPYGSGRALAVKASDWYGAFVGVKQKPNNNETVIWITRGIPSNKRFLLLPLILITVWPYLIIFLSLTSKAKPIEDEIRYHIDNAPKPISAAAGWAPAAMQPAAAYPPPPPQPAAPPPPPPPQAAG